MLLALFLAVCCCYAAFSEASWANAAEKPAPKPIDADVPEKLEPLEGRPVGVVQPRGGIRKRKRKSKLPPEGTLVIDRLCRIKTDPSGWVMLTFPAEKGRKRIRPRWALPNQTLEEMEKLALHKEKVLFRLSGETTVHEHNCFLLIRQVAVEESLPAIGSSAKAVAANTPRPAATTQPAATAAPDKTPKLAKTRPDSADLMRELLSEKNPTPVIVTPRKAAPDASEVESVAPAPRAEIILPARGNIVVDRLVTIQRTGDAKWRQATFEADNTLREPPVRLLPCRMLKSVERAPARTRLRITGKITTYKGRRFLLLRKALRERRMGQL
jgi:hypothetical protein